MSLSAATIVNGQSFFTLSIQSLTGSTTSPSNQIGYNDSLTANLTNNKGSVGTISTSVASTAVLPTDFILDETSISGINLATTSERTSPQGNASADVATSTFTFQFIIDPTDSGTLGVNFAYIHDDLGNADNGSSITWSLTDSSNNEITDFTGASIAATSDSIALSSSTLAADTYTFEISIVHDVSYNSSLGPFEISVQNLGISYTIPEPSTLFLCGFGFISLIARRKRT